MSISTDFKFYPHNKIPKQSGELLVMWSGSSEDEPKQVDRLETENIHDYIVKHSGKWFEPYQVGSLQYYIKLHS